jgi:pyruvate dehydrogenase E2 component (dihydrolipoamide acetyltransferase)
MDIVKAPRHGSYDEYVVGQWLVKVGKKVAEGDVLVRLEAPGAIVEVQSPAAGTVRKVLLAEGKLSAPGDVLCLIGKAAESIDKAMKQIAKSAPAKAPALRQEVAKSAPAAGPAEGKPPAAPPPAQQDKPQAPAGAVTPILMPQAGQSMEEGTITAWRAEVGQAIKVGDVIFEIETDKANIEVEAVDAGRLARIVVQQGQTVPVKTPVAYLAASDADVDAYLAAAGKTCAGEVPAMQEPAAKSAGKMPAIHEGETPSLQQAKSAGKMPAVHEGETPSLQQAKSAGKMPAIHEGETPSLQQAKSAGKMPAIHEGETPSLQETTRPKASPAARKLAAQRGIDVASVAGSGPQGRVLSTDVPAAGAAPRPAPAASGEAIRRKLTPMRKAIARNLLASKQNIPHFYMRMTAQADALYVAYQSAKTRFKCSVNDLIVAAVARTLRDFPAFRSRLDGEGLVEFPTANIGIAVGMENGLVVPVVVGADLMSLEQLAARTREVVEAARGGRIEGLGQGVLTITNLGMYGVEEFAAIINPPEASILAVGAIREDVVVAGGAIKPAKVVTMTLSADHRIVDGLLAAQFMAALKKAIESPE